MHEFGLCESILAVVEGRARGRRVTGVRVRVGALHRVYDEAFEQAFSMVALGSVAEGAELDLVVIPVQTTCRPHGHVTVSEEQLVVCPECGSVELDRVGGDELILESIAVEAPSAVATESH